MKKYPAKLLLFGEYGLMFGAEALAVPFSRFGGYFAVVGESSQTQKQAERKAELVKFAEWYCKSKVAEQLYFPLQIGELTNDLDTGLYFASDIPLQYGVGSSGALCAALFDRYSNFNEKHNLDGDLQPKLITKMKADFVALESYFHGRSSGLDPLVTFLNRPVRMADGRIEPVELDLGKQPWSIHLIDTGITSATSPLVKLFLKKMENKEFAAAFREQYLPVNNELVTAFVQNNEQGFFFCLEKLHEFQHAHFREMIPDAQIPLIRELRAKGILVKLLGSGGGGFLIAFAPEGVDFPDKKQSFRIF
jgi:mevalonate kinase